jgi:hypothetical protein
MDDLQMSFSSDANDVDSKSDYKIVVNVCAVCNYNFATSYTFS